MFNFDILANVDFSSVVDMAHHAAHHIANTAAMVGDIAGMVAHHAADTTSAAASHAADVVSEAINQNNPYESFWFKAARAARMGSEHSVIDLIRTGDRETDAQVVDLLKAINGSNLLHIRAQVLDLVMPLKSDYMTILLP